MAPKSLLKLVKRIFLGIVILILLLGMLALAWDMVPSDGKVTSELEVLGEHLSLDTLFFDGFPRRFVQSRTPDSSLLTLVFVHGAPGGLMAFSGIMKDKRLRMQYDMLAYDRPGYGPYDEGLAMTSIHRQASFLDTLVRDQLEAGQKVLFVSHSFGGPIAALAAIGLDTMVMGHLMLSPVISHIDEELFWYAGIPLWPPFSWISSGTWKVAAQEKIAHRSEVAALEGGWKEVTSLTYHIHGSRDRLAPIENVNFCRERFNEDHYRFEIWPRASHFIPWTERERIIHSIVEMAAF